MMPRVNCFVMEHSAEESHICEILSDLHELDVVACEGKLSVFEQLHRAQAPTGIVLDVDVQGAYSWAVAQAVAKPNVGVVFVSRYRSRAEDAWDLGAVDFVPRPLDRERVLRAGRRLARHAREQQIMSTLFAAIDEFDTSTVLRQLDYEKESDIIAVQADGNYVIAHLRSGGSRRVRSTIETFVSRRSMFLQRIHRKWAVSLPNVREIAMLGERAHLRVGDRLVIPIGKHVKKSVLRTLRELHPAKSRQAAAAQPAPSRAVVA
jgi:DNA-binding LytR/AlgR family response regulator